MTDIDRILAAMRADRIPEGQCGRWTVTRKPISRRDSDIMGATRDVEKGRPTPRVPPGTYTWLHCLTFDTAMRPPGETVMNDFPCELRKHLQFILRASGRVLVTGLGLGCVVRGLLAHKRVDHIDLVERSAEVLHLCAASVQDPRVRIIKRDAVQWMRVCEERYDFAWHDLWSDPEKSEPHLQVIHADLMATLRRRVRFQGAWAMPRWFRRRIPEFIG